MSADIPTKEPESFNAGSTVKFTRSLTDYLPADGWTLSYALVISGALITWTGSDNGDGTHLINIPAATTAAYTAGTYNWQSYVTKGAERYDLAQGVVVVKPNFATQSGGLDARSDTKIALDAITAVLKGRASQDQMAYTIAGRSLARTPVRDLILLHKRYQSMYAAEQGKLVQKVLTQF